MMAEPTHEQKEDVLAALREKDRRRTAAPWAGPDKHAGEPLTPLNDAARRQMAKHVCMNYVIRNDKPVCVYCGEEMEL